MLAFPTGTGFFSVEILDTKFSAVVCGLELAGLTFTKQGQILVTYTSNVSELAPMYRLDRSQIHDHSLKYHISYSTFLKIINAQNYSY